VNVQEKQDQFHVSILGMRILKESLTSAK